MQLAAADDRHDALDIARAARRLGAKADLAPDHEAAQGALGHRNPIETRQPLVEELEDYTASSYPCYIGKRKVPAWLTAEPTHAALGRHDRFRGYRAFVELGVEEDIRQYYAKDRQSPIRGDDDFPDCVLAHAKSVTTETARFEMRRYRSPDEVLAAVAAVLSAKPAGLRAREGNRCPEERACAMWLCQELTGLIQPELGEWFGGAHYSMAQSTKIFEALEKIQDGTNRGKRRR